MLSVIVPVYNKAGRLPELLGDLGRQSFGDFECILVDDGSADGSGGLCDAACADVRFRCIHIPNGGVSHARNVGLDAARGDYVAFVDGDDRVEPGYLAELMELARQAELGIGGFEKVRPDGSLLCRVEPKRRGLWQMDGLWRELWTEQSEQGLYGFVFGKIFSRSLIGDIRFDEGLTLAEDLDFCRRLYERARTVCFGGCTGYRYREGATLGVPCGEIDFLSQLRLLLRWRELMISRGGCTGRSRELMEKRLADNAFCVLYHTPIRRHRACFWELYDIFRREGLELSGGDLRRRWLFFCLRRGLYPPARLAVVTVRAIRRRLGRPCC